MIKKIIVSLLFIVIIINGQIIYAQDPQDELKSKIDEYQKKLTELRQQKNTLSSQIQYMDTQINLTALNIQSTENKIQLTQKEIDILTTRIEGLDNSLDYLSKMLLKRVAEGYKKRSISFFSLIFDSDNAADLISRIKYQKTAQENNQKLLVQVQETKLNFEEQKNLREAKKIELDQLTKTLTNQKIDLDKQKVQKQKLLEDTQNDETTYQKLLSQAQQQLASFKSFVQTSGADSVIAANGLGTGSDGAYYSQRDVRWANQTIGYSSESVLQVGCLLTSVAMFAKKNGQDITPTDIALDTNRFWGYTAWMKLPWPEVAGKNMVNVTNIDDELKNGNYVIVGVMINNCYNGGNHYVVLTKKEGNEYIMHDPIYGPDLKFSDHYSTICSSTTFK